MASTKRFFVKKKIWSEVKDRLLSWYLPPYLSKINQTKAQLLYVDAFAGPGIFDDGKPGSPLIALDQIEKSNAKQKTTVLLIEKNKEYSVQLEKNTAIYSTHHVVINGEFQNCVQDIIKMGSMHNLFCYLDPFSPADVNFENLLDLNSARFNSTEVLLNLNSFGFYRWACAVIGKECDDSETPDDDLDEDFSYEDESTPKTISAATSVAGGDYWESLVRKYQPLKRGYDFEIDFSTAFCKKLGESYDYVLNIPIRIKTKRIPKYRLIHCTNHFKGCVLMYDNICKRWTELQNIQNDNQLTFLQETLDYQEIRRDEIKQAFLTHLRKYKSPTYLEKCFADFFTRYGITLPLSDFKSFIKEFREANEIIVISPPTEGGKPSKTLTNAKILGKAQWM
jgi:three-Cys-motif partner protein